MVSSWEWIGSKERVRGWVRIRKRLRDKWRANGSEYKVSRSLKEEGVWEF